MKYKKVCIKHLRSILVSDIFSQISDSNGHLILWRFSEYLQEVLALPAAVYESPSFSYSDDLANTIFNTVSTDFATILIWITRN